jgi:hypothetical protein
MAALDKWEVLAIRGPVWTLSDVNLVDNLATLSLIPRLIKYAIVKATTRKDDGPCWFGGHCTRPRPQKGKIYSK